LDCFSQLIAQLHQALTLSLSTPPFCRRHTRSSGAAGGSSESLIRCQRHTFSGLFDKRRLERLLPDWSIPLGAVYWVTPPEGPLPKRVEVLGDYLIEKLARATVAENHWRAEALS